MREKEQKGYGAVLRRFLQINAASLPGFVAAVLFLCISMILQAGISLCTGELLDCVSTGRMERFFQVVAVLCLLQLWKLFFGYQVNYRVSHLSELCIRRMRSYTYSRISGASMRWMDNKKLGDIISRVNGDLNAMVEAVHTFLTWEISDLVNFIVSSAACFILNWKLSLISFCIIPVIGYLQFISGKPIASLGQKRSEADGQVGAVFMDFVGGLSVSKAFGTEQEIEKKFEKEVNKSVRASEKSFVMEFILFPLQMLMNFAPMLCIIGFGAYFVMEEQLTLGGLLSYIMIASGAFGAISGLSWQVRDIYNTVGIANRIFEIWDVEQESKGGSVTEKGTGLPVCFEQTVFGYGSGVEILHTINFRVETGEQVALVGASGSGKSTIMKLLAGFYDPNDGKIMIFGHERRTWDTEALRKQIAYVGQDAFLFPGTIRSNVLLGREGAASDDADFVLKAVGLGELDADAEIGERGVMLSGGQRQRVCIARALLKDASLILLDEPTSALDTESEYQVQEALRRLTAGKTTIMIAHRLSAIHNVDRIICIENGMVAEQGTHEELMQKNGVYRALYENQIKEESGNAE
ncbi:MAG: ABC transporter ATP-binding protein [Lachnospiraceae bacterium]